MAKSNGAQCDFDKDESVVFCRAHHACLCFNCVLNKTHDTGECTLIKTDDLKEGDRMMIRLIGIKRTVHKGLKSRLDLLSEYEALKKSLNADVETFYKAITMKLTDMYQTTLAEIETNITRTTQPILKDKAELLLLETKLGDSIAELQPTLIRSDGGIGDHSTRRKCEKMTEEAKPKVEKCNEDIPNATGSFVRLPSLDRLDAEPALGDIDIDNNRYEIILSSDMYSDTYLLVNVKTPNDTNQPGEQTEVAPAPGAPPVPEKTYKTQQQKDENEEKGKIDTSSRSSTQKSEPTPSNVVPTYLKTQKSAEAKQPGKDTNPRHETKTDKPKSKGFMQKIFGGGKGRRESVEVVGADKDPVTPETPVETETSVTTETVEIIDIETELHHNEEDACKFEAMHALTHDRIVLLDTSHNAVVLTDYQGHVIYQKSFESKVLALSAMSKSKVAILLLQGPTIHTFELVDENTFSENRPIPVAQKITDIVGFDADAERFAIITVSAVHVVNDSGVDNLSIPNVPSSRIPSDARSVYDFKTQTHYVLNISRKSIKAFSFENNAYVWKRKVEDDNFEPHDLILQTTNTATVAKDSVWIICHNQILAAEADEVKELKTEPSLASALAVCAGHQNGTLLVTMSTADRTRAKIVRVLTLQK